MKRILLGLVLIVAGACAAWWGLPEARMALKPWVPEGIATHLPVRQVGAESTASPKRKGPPPAPVTVATVTLADMPVILSAPGTVEARATVAIKPRVDGQISEVLFKEGDLVKEGQVLFRLDDRLIRAQIAQAEAIVKRDEAIFADAQGTYNRRIALVQKKIVSEQAMDTAKATMEALKASIIANKAAAEAQKTQLDYLVISAPITGRTGSTTFKAGANIRAADVTPLVIINQTQPILVTFSVPQSDIAALRRALAAKSTAEVIVLGQKPERREGKIDFIDNQVDKQTGTLAAKVLVPNADELLWPGLSTEVALKVEVRRDMPSVPASAVLPSQQGMLVWIVGADNRASPRNVTLDRIVGQTAYISEGLSAGERVITDGQIRVAPGLPVAVQEPGKGPPAKGEKGGKAGSDANGDAGKGEKRPASPANGGNGAADDSSARADQRKS